MSKNEYLLYTECHRIYTQGFRRVMRERLKEAHGDDWIKRGVFPALTEKQLENLSITLAHQDSDDPSNTLDAVHFLRIVRWNHAAAFADAFSDIDIVLKRLRLLMDMRNEWAHIPEDGMPFNKVEEAIKAMVGILVPLRCREAMEIENLLESYESNENKDESGKIPNSETLVKETNNDEIEGQSEAETMSDQNDDAKDQTKDFRRLQATNEEDPNEGLDEPMFTALEMWRNLQSYLVLDSSIEYIEERRTTKAKVTVRVSNVAPIGENRPEVFFKSVALKTMGRNSEQSTQMSPLLTPGESVERQFTFEAKELASVEFRVSGDIDTAKLFKIHQKGGLPREVVKPLLNEFSRKFETIGIKEPMNCALASIGKIQPNMTITEASQVRRELEQIEPLIEEKISALQELFREFHLNKSSSLGAQCHEVWLFLSNLRAKIQAVVNAISETDTTSISEAVHNVEQLQIAVLQVEETIRASVSSRQ